MPATPKITRPHAVLAVLFAGAFVMGCAEMLVVGMIDLIADDLAVSLSNAGALVTANALGLAIGGPVLTFLTTRFDRRHVLIAASAVFLVANLLPATIADYPVFLVARVVIGAVQGLFIAAAMITATAVTPPERAGRAMAVVISGFATASALGLPLGTLLGRAIGWRGAFVAVVLAALVVLVLVIVLLPSIPTASGSRAIGQARHAFAPRVLAVLAVSVLTFAGMQAAITYLVPFLDQVTGVEGGIVTAYLLLYGVATTVGSVLGGRFADANAPRMLVIGAAGVAASLGLMLAFGGSPWIAVLAVLGIGLMGMATTPSLQHRVVGLAGVGGPLAASLPASAVNVGIALGAFAGGVAIDIAGVTLAVVTGLGIAIIAIVAAWATSLLRVPIAEPASLASR
ncbi:MFS transporter [Microbacterium hydrocarbonoxydans]|uniref:MFS transporter n=1 Tax=Microbacterium hydrocarbonoxydans TaxID=273678 RepID=UPI00203DC95D|nr:MFS transporter [Microbacterium hydrocarbonoxydans]MCM3778423.1 MFS transporter [Microbacterium hydrocarbonoxydans]